MFGFLVKKTFFDLWDNILTIVLLNLGFIPIAAYLFFTLCFFGYNILFLLLAAASGGYLFYLYTGIASRILKNISDFKKAKIKYIASYFKETFKYSLIMGTISAFHISTLITSYVYYLGKLGNTPGVIIFAIIFWISVFWIISSQYYFPICIRLEKNVKKIFMKCFIITIDNTFFSISTWIVSLSFFIIPIVLLLHFHNSGVAVLLGVFVPGISTVLLLQQNALKLRLYKYDYLEENPEADRKKIPWDVLLAKDREKLGPRTLKGMIFPWKEE